MLPQINCLRQFYLINFIPLAGLQHRQMAAPRILRASAPLFGTVVVGGPLYALSQHSNYSDASQKNPSISTESTKPSNSNPVDAPKIFTGGISFQTLKLQSAEQVNHNTKRLRFELPDPNAVSGLRPICERSSNPKPQP